MQDQSFQDIALLPLISEPYGFKSKCNSAISYKLWSCVPFSQQLVRHCTVTLQPCNSCLSSTLDSFVHKWLSPKMQVDNWVYDEANTTFIDDDDMQKRLMDMNPNSFRKLVATFLEANGRGYWEATPDQIDRLRQLYMDVEDKIEGVD